MNSFIPEVVSKSLELKSRHHIQFTNLQFGSVDFFKTADLLSPFTFKTPSVPSDQTVLETLLTHMGSIKIRVRTGDYAHPYKYIHDRKYEELDFKEYIRNFSAVGQKGYAGNVKISWPAFLPLFESCNFNEELYESPSIWIGPTDSITPLHIDGLDNISFQLMGKKRWILIDPIYYSSLQMIAPFSEFPNLHVSEIDLREGFSILEERSIPTHLVAVDKGEGLYLPAGWGHFVLTDSPSVMVNLWANKKSCKPRILK